jgi:hypothetical protein
VGYIEKGSGDTTSERARGREWLERERKINGVRERRVEGWREGEGE